MTCGLICDQCGHETNDLELLNCPQCNAWLRLWNTDNPWQPRERTMRHVFGNPKRRRPR